MSQAPPHVDVPSPSGEGQGEGSALARASPLDGARIVLGVTGSIAAYKAAEVARALGRAGAAVQPVMTPAAARFLPPLTLSVLTGRETLTDLFPDADRPGSGAASAWTKHVELGLWADAVVIAPATAQTLAALAHGFCDTLLAAVVLSARCPVLVAPAMDHDMWLHPATQRNVAHLRADGVHVVEPAEGPLASGLVGQGRLPEPDDLVTEIARWMASNRTASTEETASMAGTSVLVTAGPTREAADPVRFLSNGSTGTMGFEVAAAAARRGATVTLLAGPVSLATPPGVVRVDVVSADDLLAAALAHADADLVIAAAAVSDYAPADPSGVKMAKTDGELTMRLRRTPDVLATLGAQKRPGQTLVGFALETHDGEAHARAKLARKRLDWIALNTADAPGEGFGTGTNRLTLLAADGRRVDVPLGPKRDVAEALLDAVTS